MHDYSYKIGNRHEFVYKANNRHKFIYNRAILNTDPDTGATWLFDGGYFRRDGVFIRNATFERN